MRLCKCDFLHLCCELSIHEVREQGEDVHTKARINRVRWRIWIFFFWKLRTSPNVLTPTDASFQTSENFWECGLKKKLSKIKTNMCSILAHDTRRQSGETWDLCFGHHGPLKKREVTRRDTSTRGYTRASEASVSIYILALALSWVLSVRLYSQH